MPDRTRFYHTALDRRDLVKVLALIASLERNERSDWQLDVLCRDELSRAVLDKLRLPRVTTTASHAVVSLDPSAVYLSPEWFFRAPPAHALPPPPVAKTDADYAAALATAYATLRSVLPDYAFDSALPNDSMPVTLQRRANEPMNAPFTMPQVATQPVTKSAVLEALRARNVEDALVEVLGAAGRALSEVWSGSDLETARGSLVGIVAHALEAATETLAADTTSEAAIALKVQRLAKTIEAATAANDDETALTALAELLETVPTHPDAQLTAGHLHMRSGNFRTAQDHLVRATVLASDAEDDVKNDVAEALVQLAAGWRESREPGLARLSAERALRLVPAYAPANELLASLAAPPFAAQATAAHAPLRIASVDLTPTVNRAAAPAASVHSFSFSPVATSAPQQPAAAKDPSPVSLAQRDALFEEGERAVGAGHWTRARELFGAIADAHPNFAPAHVGLASAAFAAGEVDAGLAALDRACALEPNDSNLLAQRGKLLLQTGRLHAATEAFRQLVATHPRSVDGRIGLAECHRLADRPIDAIEVLDQAQQAFPNEPAFIAAIGILAAQLGDKESASTALATLQALAPQHPQTAALRGAIASGAPLFAP